MRYLKSLLVLGSFIIGLGTACASALPPVQTDNIVFLTDSGKAALSNLKLDSPQNWTADDNGITCKSDNWGWFFATVSPKIKDYRLDVDISVQVKPGQAADLVNPLNGNYPGLVFRKTGDRAASFYLGQPCGGWAAHARLLPYIGGKFAGKDTLYGMSKNDEPGWHHLTALVKGNLSNLYVDDQLVCILDISGYDGDEVGLSCVFGGKFKSFTISKMQSETKLKTTRPVRSFLWDDKVFQSKHKWRDLLAKAGEALDKTIEQGTEGVPGQEHMPTFTYRCVTWFTPGVRPFYAYPAFHHTQMMDTLLKYSTYKKDRKYLKTALLLADWELEHMTPATDALPHLPYSTTYNGKMGGNVDGDTVMVDKAGVMGSMLLRLWKMTGEEKYKKGAEKIASTLLKVQLPDGRWQNRVVHETGKVVQDYTSNQIFNIRFMDSMFEATVDKQYAKSAKRALDWVLKNPVKTWRWTGFYEDVGPHEESIGHWDAIETARYLLEHRKGHPEYVTIAEDICSWMATSFAVKEDGRWPMMCEQSACMPTMAGHSLHLAPLLVDLYKATGKDYYRKSAVSATNAAFDSIGDGQDKANAWYNSIFSPIWLGIELARDLKL